MIHDAEARQLSDALRATLARMARRMDAVTKARITFAADQELEARLARFQRRYDVANQAQAIRTLIDSALIELGI